MRVAFALFADAANLSQEGKLNVLGVFDALHVGAVPTVHPRACLVVHLKGTALDVGQHRVMLRWLNPSGRELWQSTGELAVGAPPPNIGEMDLPLIAQVDLPIDVPGTYTMSVSIGEQSTAEVAVQVRTAVAAPPVSPHRMVS